MNMLNKGLFLKKFVFGVINTILVFLLVFVVVEITLRLGFAHKKYYVFPPSRSFTVNTAGILLPHTDLNPVVTTNSLGLRGPELPRFISKNDYTILFVGGSTTECGYLKDDDTWPALVASNYNAFSQRKYTIISENAGKSAHSTRNHIILLEKLLPQIKPSCVIILAGANDLALIGRKDYRSDYYNNPDMFENIKEETFWNFELKEDPSVPFYKKFMMWRFAKRVKWENADYSILRDNFLQSASYVKMRRVRRAKSLRASNLLSNPDFIWRLKEGLVEYRRNILQIADICRRAKVRVIFMNQPTLYRDGLTDELKQLLWLGKIQFLSKDESLVYCSEKDCADALSLYNNFLKKTCLENNVEYIDLAEIVNKDTDNFYDDGHFNIKGARKVSEVVAHYLRNNL